MKHENQFEVVLCFLYVLNSVNDSSSIIIVIEKYYERLKFLNLLSEILQDVNLRNGKNFKSIAKG